MNSKLWTRRIGAPRSSKFTRVGSGGIGNTAYFMAGSSGGVSAPFDPLEFTPDPTKPGPTIPKIDISNLEQRPIDYQLEDCHIENETVISPVLLLWDISIEVWGMKKDPGSIIKEILGLIIMEALYFSQFPKGLLRVIHTHLTQELTSKKTLSVSPTSDYFQSTTRIRQLTRTSSVSLKNASRFIGQRRTVNPVVKNQILGPISYSFALKMLPYNPSQMITLMDHGYEALEGKANIRGSIKIDKYLDIMGQSLNFEFVNIIREIKGKIQILDVEDAGLAQIAWRD
uniref:Uncharacterized protein n=1 Tax=Coleopteran rhabdo-related virus OKIAV28 TaxID=2746288 RepID=A0A7D7JFM9_9RHAB|nr:hypothetical protein [Coleopteran rhabdo-related virus OKIAV28]